MALSLLKLGPKLFGSMENLIAYMQQLGLLATTKTCPSCSTTMRLQRRGDITDQFRLQYIYTHAISLH